jgi:hypothetical protein
MPVSYDGTNPGVYTMKDNAIFTGLCKGTTCEIPPWDLGAGNHLIEDFGPDDPPSRDSIDEKRDTFGYYMLNKNAFEQTDRRTMRALRADSYVLLSAGKDALYGSDDDVNNLGEN